MPDSATCRTIGRVVNPYPPNSPWRRKPSGHRAEVRRVYAVSKRLRLVVSPLESTEKATEEKFRRLAGKWHDETDMYSSTLKVIAHPAYLTIVAMGQSAIPLVLREMKQGPGHWFPAINALTEDLRAEGENPASGCATSSEARAAWVKWGESKGYL
jgi:hypothetical protein